MAESSIKIVHGLCAGGESCPVCRRVLRVRRMFTFYPRRSMQLSPMPTTDTSSFFDSNPASQIEKFGVMAHVYSTFESCSDLKTPKPMIRGSKSFELLNSANRWYFIQVYWDWESPDNPFQSAICMTVSNKLARTSERRNIGKN